MVEEGGSLGAAVVAVGFALLTLTPTPASAHAPKDANSKDFDYPLVRAVRGGSSSIS